ncbi:MAG: hypothetical protein ACUVYA_02235, partial [Planctomycetota bacterium]
SKDEEKAREALDELKAAGYAADSRHYERALNFLDDTFDQTTTYLREPDLQPNSLAESGMRTLRRPEQEHDGFRTDGSREDFLRIYQAIKYLGCRSTGPHPAASASARPELARNRWDTPPKALEAGRGGTRLGGRVTGGRGVCF